MNNRGYGTCPKGARRLFATTSIPTSSSWENRWGWNEGPWKQEAKSTLQFAWCWKLHSRTRGFAQKKCRLHCTLWSVTVQVFKAFWKALHLITDNLCEFYSTINVALMSSRRRTNQSALFKSAIGKDWRELSAWCALKLFKIPTENGLNKFVFKTLRIALLKRSKLYSMKSWLQFLECLLSLKVFPI